MTAPAKVGLVLGAGGVAGHSFHAGVLKALAEATGWDPRTAEVVVGTSAGSVVGVALRAGLDADDLYARTVGDPLSDHGRALLEPVPEPRSGLGFEALPRAGLPRPASLNLITQLALRPWRVRPGLLLAGLLPEGRLDASQIGADVELLLAHAGVAPERLWVNTVRLRDGRRVVFGRDAKLPDGWTWGQAVAASCAIPGFMAPVSVNGTKLVDGGAHSPTNADLLAGMDLDLVVVSSPMSSVRTARLRSIDAPVRVLYRLRLAAELAALRRRGVPMLVFQPTHGVLAAQGLNAMDPELRVPVADASYRSALRRCEQAEIARHEALSA